MAKKKIRLGMIGCGGNMRGAHVPPVRADGQGELVSVMDTEEEQARLETEAAAAAEAEAKEREAQVAAAKAFQPDFREVISNQVGEGGREIRLV